jgi:hypothetical protein
MKDRQSVIASIWISYLQMRSVESHVRRGEGKKEGEDGVGPEDRWRFFLSFMRDT